MPVSSPSTRIALTPPSRYDAAWRTRLAGVASSTPEVAFDVAEGDSMLVAVAHPDDETLAMGAALAQLAAGGVTVHLLVMTAGEAALDHVGVHVEDLGGRRRRELAAAAGALGAASVAVVGLPDGRLAAHAREMRRAVSQALAATGARQVATLWHRDPHPDHRAVSTAAAAAAGPTGAGVTELALWTTHWTDPVEVTGDVGLVVSTDTAARAKRAALACYDSQTRPLTDELEPVLPASVLTWPHEYLVRP